MTDDILRSTNQIGSLKTADLYKSIIAVRNHPPNVCGRDELLLRCECDLTLCYRLIISHSDGSLVPLEAIGQ